MAKQKLARESVNTVPYLPLHSSCFIFLLMGLHFSYPGLAPMMVNFMCQLDWATECPNTWLNLILCVSVRVFLDEMNM